MLKCNLLPLALFGISPVGSLHAQESALSLPLLRPSRLVMDTSNGLPPDFKFYRRFEDYPYGSLDSEAKGAEQQKRYDAVFLYPQIGGVTEGSIFNNVSKTITGGRLRWTKQPNSEVYASEREIVWSWDVPRPLEAKEWVAYTGPRDRYGAILFSAILKQPRRLVFFDKEKGFDHSVMLNFETLCPPITDEQSNKPTHEGWFPDATDGVFSEGNKRLLFTVSAYNEEVSTLLVLDLKGNLVSSVRLVGFYPSALHRDYSGKRFILQLGDEKTKQGRSFLLDENGAFFGEFVDPDGKGISIYSMKTDKSAYRGLGSTGHYDFEVPPASAVAVKIDRLVAGKQAKPVEATATK